MIGDEARDMARIADWLERHRDDEITPDVEGRRRLARQGWELKSDGILHAPTSSGETVPMWREDVIFGAAAGPFQNRVRASLQPAYKAAFTEWMFNVAKFRSENAAYGQLTPGEKKALSEGQDDAGGYLVPADISAEVLARTAQLAVVRPHATIIPTSRDTLSIPRAMPHASSGSTYASAFTATWSGETPAFSGTDPVFGQFGIPIKKIRAVTKLADDLVSDSKASVLAFLAQHGGTNMAVAEDQGFIAGDGAALQPLGILNGGSTTVDVDGSTANTISNTNAATGSAPKLMDLAFALPSQYARGARWIARRSVEGHVRKLVDFQNRFQYPASDLIGKPIDNSDAMPVDDTDANKVLIFGDLSGYVIATRTELSVRVLRERFADTMETGLILISRLGGAVFNSDSFRIGIV